MFYGDFTSIQIRLHKYRPVNNLFLVTYTD